MQSLSKREAPSWLTRILDLQRNIPTHVFVDRTGAATCGALLALHTVNSILHHRYWQEDSAAASMETTERRNLLSPSA